MRAEPKKMIARDTPRSASRVCGSTYSHSMRMVRASALIMKSAFL